MSATDRLSDTDVGLHAVPVATESGFPWHRVGLALLVCAGYYLGARLGLALTFDPLPVSS